MSAMTTVRAGRHANHAMAYEDVEGQEGQACWADTIVARLDSICTIPLFDTSQLGIFVYDMTEGMPLYTRNATHRMRPASNQKIVTSVAALHLLGGDFRFGTELRVVGECSDSTLNGNVYVVGAMDPVLSQEDVRSMAGALREIGIDSINGQVCLDMGIKDDLEYGWGWCWDDDYGPLSALLVDAKDNFPAVWRQALEEYGIAMGDTCIAVGDTPQEAATIFCVSHGIDEVLAEVMKNSDNIYAECLFYRIAASSGQRRAGRKQAVAMIETMMEALGIDAGICQIADGSGLSLYNYLTPEVLVRLLNYAYINEDIRLHLFPSFPIAGVDGTLKKRMRTGPAMQNVRAKTGSVDGVSSLSGYLISGNGHLLTFSIINQGVARGADARDFQDNVCMILCSK